MTTRDRQELERTLKVGTKVLLFNAGLAVLLLILNIILC
jgi:hypothetical protein